MPMSRSIVSKQSFAIAMLATVCLAPPCAQAETIAILAGAKSGVNYPVGAALAQIYTDRIGGVQASVQDTKTAVENLVLLDQGRGEMAFAPGDSLDFAWTGNPDQGFKDKLDRLRGIAAIYPNHIQIVATKKSGITTIADLKGKRLSVGAPDSGTARESKTLLAASGLDGTDLRQIDHLPFAESVDRMKNGGLDAVLVSAGLGAAAIHDLAYAIDVTIVAIPGPIVDEMGAPYIKSLIPKNTYAGQNRDVPDATVLNYLVTRADLSDNLVYRMTQQIFESPADLSAAHPAAADILFRQALVGMPVPLHPGAGQYYRDKGLLPAAARD